MRVLLIVAQNGFRDEEYFKPKTILEDVVYAALPVVVDGRIVTANGPEAAEEFGKALVKMLGL